MDRRKPSTAHTVHWSERGQATERCDQRTVTHTAESSWSRTRLCRNYFVAPFNRDAMRLAVDSSLHCEIPSSLGSSTGIVDESPDGTSRGRTCSLFRTRLRSSLTAA